jgi:hypothetical protein
MAECGVCYSASCNCRLVCGHSFCRDCVKSWYQKGSGDSTCPMCRQRLYFKGLYKVAGSWDDERSSILEESFFLEQFESLCSDPGDFLLYELYDLQHDYNFSVRMGVDFEWYFNNKDYFDIVDNSQTVIMNDDVYSERVVCHRYPRRIRWWSP